MSTEFDRVLALVGTTKLPPVATWHPDREGEIDIRIGEDGTWYHEGREIRRKEISKIFSTILRREGEGYFLVTPVEKLRIRVVDAPFLAVDMEASGTGRDQSLVFRTSLDEYVLIDEQHPIWVETKGDEERPYIQVRDRLNALVARSVYYRLIDFIDETELAVWSAGCRFSLLPV